MSGLALTAVRRSDYFGSLGIDRLVNTAPVKLVIRGVATIGSHQRLLVAYAANMLSQEETLAYTTRRRMTSGLN